MYKPYITVIAYISALHLCNIFVFLQFFIPFWCCKKIVKLLIFSLKNFLSEVLNTIIANEKYIFYFIQHIFIMMIGESGTYIFCLNNYLPKSHVTCKYWTNCVSYSFNGKWIFRFFMMISWSAYFNWCFLAFLLFITVAAYLD